MKKGNIIVFIVLLLLVVSSVVFYCVQFIYSPGVHVIGDAIHYEVFDSVYIVGGDGEKTNLTFCGTYDGKAYAGGCGSFYGVIEVSAYPVPYSAANGFIANEGRGILFTQRGDYFSAKYYSTTIDEEGYAIQSGWQYMVILKADAPEEIIIVIYEENGSPVAAAVNGSTQEESNRIYNDYIESIR